MKPEMDRDIVLSKYPLFLIISFDQFLQTSIRNRRGTTLNILAKFKTMNFLIWIQNSTYLK